MLSFICGIISVFGFANSDSFVENAEQQDTLGIKADTSSTRILTMRRVFIIGNKKTHDKIIARELSLHDGDTVSVGRLVKILVRDKNRIYNLRLFNTVNLRILELGDDIFDLLIDVNERWYTFPAPIFEFADRNFNEWWQNYNHDFHRVNYGLRLYQYNFRGRNETLTFTSQFGFSRKFDLTYRIPYIDRKQKQGLFFAFDYSEPKNLAYYTKDHKLVFYPPERTFPQVTLRKSFGMSITYNYRKSFYETHSLLLGYRHTSIIDTIAQLNPNYFLNGGTVLHFKTLSYVFNTDHRDVILYPLKGYQYTATISKLGLGMGDNLNQFEITLTQARHWDLGNKYYVSNFTAGFLSAPRNQPYSLYSALGFRKQLIRGYEIYVIEGPAYFLNKSTLKKRIFYRNWQWKQFPFQQFRYIPLAIYAKGYFDFGYVQNYKRYQELGINKTLSNKWLGGAGGGFDIVTVYDLVFRLEYTFTTEVGSGFFFNVKKEF